jgi:Flp pilus assembly pilin Flp
MNRRRSDMEGKTLSQPHNASSRSLPRRTLLAFLKDESGPTATEYAFVLSVILLTALAAISAMGIANRDIWQYIADSLNISIQ